MTEEGTHWGRIAALWFAGLVAAAQFAKVGVVFDGLGAVWPVGPVALGLIVSVVGIVGIVFGTSAGVAVARIGARRMILAGLAAGALLSAAEAFLPPYIPMVVLRIAEGFSHLAIVVAGPVLIAQAAQAKDQPAAMTLWSTFFAVAFSLAAWVERPFADRHGLGAAFLAHAGLMAGAAVLLALMLPRMPGGGPRAVREAVLIAHARIYRSPFIAAPALGFVFYTLQFVAYLTLLPELVGAGWQALTATLMPLASIGLSLTLGVTLTRRVGPVRVVQLGLGGGALSAVAVAALAGTGAPAFVAALALSAALGLVQGASFASVTALNRSDAARAEAAGAIAQLGNVGTTLGTPLLVGLLAWGGPMMLPLYAVPLGVAGIAVCAWLAARRHELGDQRP